MSDVNRVVEIAALEEKIRILQAQVAEYKANSDKWTPVVTSIADENTVKISLRFAGKMTTAELSHELLASNNQTVLGDVIDALSIVFDDRIEQVISPELEKLRHYVLSRKKNQR